MEREARTAFKKHQTSDCHRGALEALLRRASTLYQRYSKVTECRTCCAESPQPSCVQLFMRILNNSVKVPCPRDWPCEVMGMNRDEFNSNFIQLLLLHELNCDDVDVESWLAELVTCNLSYVICF